MKLLTLLLDGCASVSTRHSKQNPFFTKGKTPGFILQYSDGEQNSVKISDEETLELAIESGHHLFELIPVDKLVLNANSTESVKQKERESNINKEEEEVVDEDEMFMSDNDLQDQMFGTDETKDILEEKHDTQLDNDNDDDDDLQDEMFNQTNKQAEFMVVKSGPIIEHHCSICGKGEGPYGAHLQSKEHKTKLAIHSNRYHANTQRNHVKNRIDINSNYKGPVWHCNICGEGKGDYQTHIESKEHKYRSRNKPYQRHKSVTRHKANNSPSQVINMQPSFPVVNQPTMVQFGNQNMIVMPTHHAQIQQQQQRQMIHPMAMKQQQHQQQQQLLQPMVIKPVVIQQQQQQQQQQQYFHPMLIKQQQQQYIIPNQMQGIPVMNTIPLHQHLAHGNARPMMMVAPQHIQRATQAGSFIPVVPTILKHPDPITHQNVTPTNSAIEKAQMDAKNTELDQECAICYHPYGKDRRNIVQCPKCKLKLHSNCWNEWKKKDKCCPNCRQSLTNE